MNIIERLANTIGRTRGHFLKGLEDVFSTSGIGRPGTEDDSASTTIS